MKYLFMNILNMSIRANYVILAVIVIRLLLRRSPKIISYALWSVVAFRLLCPFSLESNLSILPRTKISNAHISRDIIHDIDPQVNLETARVDNIVKNSIPRSTPDIIVNPMETYMRIGIYIWLMGILTMLTYSIVSIIILKNKLKEANHMGGNIYEAKNLRTPFVLGITEPKIYLPVGINEEERYYILRHEKVHIKRYDHLIKPFAFLILCVHWFNPLVWISFILMSKDMELSCDERVLRDADSNAKKLYANSLLSLASEKHILNGGPLAFGGGSVKSRIKRILNYKKPPFWIIILSLVTVTLVGIGLLTNPKTSLNSKSLQSYTGAYQIDELLYMCPENTNHPMEGITNFYGISETAFAIIDSNNGKTKEKFDNIKWKGQKLSRKKWEDMFQADYLTYDFNDLEASSKLIYIISDSYNLLEMDDELWLAEINDGHIWNVYSLSRVDLPIKDGELDVTRDKLDKKIKLTEPKWYPSQTTGADMVELDYVSDEIIIFHGYFGLYVYDLKDQRIIASLDLKTIGCHMTQGDDYCQATVSKDGNIVNLHPISSEDMYVYTVSDHTLDRVPYKPMEEEFKFNNGEYGYLYSENGTLGTLVYIRGDKSYGLFKNEETVISSVKELTPSKIVITYTNPTDKEVSYGDTHILQGWNGQEWFNIPLKPNVAWRDILNILKANKSVKESIDFESMYGELDTGHYRIIKPMKIVSSSIDVITQFDVQNEIIEIE